jgi:gliding motility-associated protein GldE
LDTEPSSLRFFLEILQPFQPELIAPFIILLVLLLLSALISGSEVAFFSLKAQDIEGLKAKQKDLYETLYDLLDKPKTLLGTILIANNFINVGIVILSAFITEALFDFSEYPRVGFAVQVIAITFILLLFGEVLPKVYASKNPLGFSSFMSRPMQILRQLFKPLSVVLVKSSGLIERRLKSNTENLSVDDLSQALEITSQESATAEDQRILEGIVKFGSTTVKQIMKSRLDVTCVDEQWDYKKVLDVILESGYSRIPVYQDNFDTIKGVLYIKDLLPHISEEPSFKWTELIRDSFFVPENKKIDDLLKEFQEKKIHLAVVADEFGGTSGIITLEDVIEEIVGEISDEFDDEELVYSKLDDLNYVFEGKIHFTDFLKVVSADEEEFEEHRAEADTLAGFLLEISGKFPEKNEEIIFNDYTFTVESLEGRRINRIKVTLQPKEEEDD